MKINTEIGALGALEAHNDLGKNFLQWTCVLITTPVHRGFNLGGYPGA